MARKVKDAASPIDARALSELLKDNPQPRPFPAIPQLEDLVGAIDKTLTKPLNEHLEKTMADLNLDDIEASQKRVERLNRITRHYSPVKDVVRGSLNSFNPVTSAIQRNTLRQELHKEREALRNAERRIERGPR